MLKIIVNNKILRNKVDITTILRFFNLIILNNINFAKRFFNNTNVVRFFQVFIKFSKFVELFDNFVYYLCQ